MAAPIEVQASQIRVSSVLNRDTKQFGKKYLVDGNEDTCWNSDQGSPQWISIDFERGVNICALKIQFQGGFAGKDCWIEGKTSDSPDWEKITDFYPEDNNSLQIFKMKENCKTVTSIKIVFNQSTDFFGRITIYKLELIGELR